MISRGMLRKLVGKVTESLADPYEALCAILPTEDRLNVDETGHKENGQRLWTWCFRAYLYTVYKISPSRGSEVLVATLGKEFNGILSATTSVRTTSTCVISESCCSSAWHI